MDQWKRENLRESDDGGKIDCKRCNKRYGQEGVMTAGGMKDQIWQEVVKTEIDGRVV